MWRRFNSVEQGPSWEVNISPGRQEILHTLWNRACKSPPLAPTLSHVTPFHILRPYFCTICFNILPCTRMASELILSFRFSSKNHLSIFIPYHACHTPSPLHSLWFDHPGDYLDDYQSSARSRSIDIVAVNSQVWVLTYLKIGFNWRKTCYCLETARFVAAPSKDSVSVSPLFTLQWIVTSMNEREQENWRHW
jgi:hypothetical protein